MINTIHCKAPARVGADADQNGTRTTAVSVLTTLATMVVVWVNVGSMGLANAFHGHSQYQRRLDRPFLTKGQPLPSVVSEVAYATKLFQKPKGSFLALSLSSSSPPSNEGDENNYDAVVEYNDFLPGPNQDLTALDVVQLCMETLKEDRTAGLEVCFDFSSDKCRAAIGGSLEQFQDYATNPTFSFLVTCNDWNIVSMGPIIQGTPTRGSMQTILMQASNQKAKKQKLTKLQQLRMDGATGEKDENSEEGERRRFLWTMQQERRPPRQGCWLIHEVMYVNNAFQLTE